MTATIRVDVRFSVCMAVCNGSLYLREQVLSILAQLDSKDEIVVCDDNSTDDSLDVIVAIGDPRIRVYSNKKRLGHVKNFEKVISLARGQYILLSDQDDVWIGSRLSLFLAELARVERPVLVVGDYIEVTDTLAPLDSKNNKVQISGIGANRVPIALDILLGRSKYYGCCFAFNRALVDQILPFPAKIEAHDMWIGLVASVFHTVVAIDKVTLKRRIHGKNLTPFKRRSLYLIAKSRYTYVKELFLFSFRHRWGKS